MKSLVAVAAAIAFALPGLAQTPVGRPVSAQLVCQRCGWRPPAATRKVVVSSYAELDRAVRGARPGDEIVLADGRYSLERTLEIGAPGVTLRGQSGDPGRVTLHGRGMTGDTVGVAVAAGASRVTIADLTIRSVGFHAVQVRGESGASNFTLHNTVLEDAGQQLLKGSFNDNGQYASDGLVACSVFAYTRSAPSDYTNGVDLLGTRRWVIRDNRFARIRGPLNAAGPTVLAWKGAEDTLVERNLIVDSFRGIALGLVDRYGAKPDHLRGVVRNNVVVNLNSWADEGIEANGASGARMYHNTVLVQGALPWSISVRFPMSSVDVRNNLTSKPVLSRNGGVLAFNQGNVSGATVEWFVSAPGLDLHLNPEAIRAINAGVALDDASGDFDRQPRSAGTAPDAGAYEGGAPGGRGAGTR